MRDSTIKSDLQRLDALGDEDIDYSDIPELDDEFFRTAKVVVPPGKQQITLRLDSDVLRWFRGQGKGYQTRINAVLRRYYEAHERKLSDTED
ncbi:MAG: BrnA antitoxin family protein [Acidobacteriota bacterium]